MNSGITVKKANACLSILAIAMLLIHVFYQIFSYIMFYYNPVISKILGYGLVAVLVFHGIFSLFCVFVMNDSHNILNKIFNMSANKPFTVDYRRGACLHTESCSHETRSKCGFLKLHLICHTIFYRKLNIRTWLQRISAIVAVILLPLHILGFGMLTKTAGTILFYFAEAVQILFYAAIISHIVFSFSSALISLGFLENIKTKKIIDRVVWLIGVILFLIISYVIIQTHIKIFNM